MRTDDRAGAFAVGFILVGENRVQSSVARVGPRATVLCIANLTGHTLFHVAVPALAKRYWRFFRTDRAASIQTKIISTYFGFRSSSVMA